MKTSNMGGGCRICLCFLVILFVDFQLTEGKPFFTGRFFCDLFCEDEDDLNVSTPSTTTSLEDALDALWDPCTDCPTRRPPTVPPGFPAGFPGFPPGFVPPFFIPPGFNGWNVTMMPNPNSPGSWYMVPLQPGATPNPSSQTPAATTAAPPTTAGGTTAGSTAAATTAAPTTAAG